MLEHEIDRLFKKNPEDFTHQDMEVFEEFKKALNAGKVRAAEPSTETPLG
jgi:hypothetical protein